MWRMLSLIKSILLVVFVCLANSGRLDLLGESTEFYQFEAQLSADDAFKIFWVTDRTTITMELHVKTHGWVGLGFSTDSLMANSDIVLLNIDKRGQATISDRHGVLNVQGDNIEPIVDTEQDYELLKWGRYSDGVMFTIRRKLAACDEHDFEIRKGTIKLIWAFSEETVTDNDHFDYHGANRGDATVDLIHVFRPQKMPQDVEVYEFKANNITLPSVESAFWCQPFKLPDNLIKNPGYIIKWEVILEPKSITKYLRHIGFILCNGEDLRTLYLHNSEQNNGGGRCNHPRRREMCREIYQMSYANGTLKPFYFPKKYGLFLNAQAIVLKMHHHIKTQEKIRSSSGLRIYVTREPRKGASTINLGRSWPVIWPPHSMFLTKVVCDADLLALAMERAKVSQVTAFAGWAHSHMGKRVLIRLVRNGREIAQPVRDDYYDVRNQPTRLFDEPLVIRKGDELNVECEYNNLKREETTFTVAEHCAAYLYVSPPLDIMGCRSNIVFPFELVEALSEEDENLKRLYERKRCAEKTDLNEWALENLNMASTLLKGKKNWNEASIKLFQYYSVWGTHVTQTYCGDPFYFPKTNCTLNLALDKRLVNKRKIPNPLRKYYNPAGYCKNYYFKGPERYHEKDLALLFENVKLWKTRKTSNKSSVKVPNE